jgi:valyl-tRNA synthetase
MVCSKLSAAAILNGMETYVQLESLNDVELERTRCSRKLKKVHEDFFRLETKLARSDFLEKAPEDIIDNEQAIHRGLREQTEKLAHVLEFIQ